MKLTEKKRIVVKVGTSTLTHDTGKTNIARMAKLVSVLADLKNAGHQVVLVSSGAVGIGAGKLGMHERPDHTSGLQACAAVGQCEVMFLYDKLFSEYGVVVSQLLFTGYTLNHPEEKAHLVDTFNQLLEYDALPIVNENDSVSVEELLHGDNDCLSATVAQLIGADLLILLTDTDGRVDANPAENEDARLIGRVAEINDDVSAGAGGAGSKGTGGFTTKIRAAEIATGAGIPVIIMNGERPTAIYKVLDGQPIGTYFEANSR